MSSRLRTAVGPRPMGVGSAPTGRRSVLLAAASLGLSFALPALPARAARRRGLVRPR